MKKVFLLLLGFILTFSVMAQTLSGDFKINQIDKGAQQVNVPLLNNFRTSTFLAPGDIQHEWVNFGYALCEVTVGDAAKNYRVTSGILFPDTFAIIRYWDTDNGKFVYRNSNWCSVGSVLDPTSAVLRAAWGDAKVVKPGATYTVDSIRIPFWYDRYSDTNVVDTLIIQMYKPKNISAYTYSAGENSGKKAFAVPKYSRSKKEGAMADWVKRIPLKASDTIMSRLGYIVEAIPDFTITGGGPVAVTWTFKSGSVYNKLDTIPLAKWDSLPNVQKPLNAFLWLYYTDRTDPPLALYEFNNGVNINSQQRYSDLIFSGQTTSIFPSTYLPFTMWTNPVYPYVEIKLTWTETVGINHVANNVKVQLYPSPTTSTQDMNLDMTLDSKKNISIDVYDMLGHKVSSVTSGTYNSGKHSFTISTSNLATGMYICNIIADGAVKTIKFEVK